VSWTVVDIAAEHLRAATPSASSYLFASQDTLTQLGQKAAKIGNRGLLELFPNLVVAVARVHPIWDTDEDQKKGFNKPNLMRRRCRARIFQPIKPIDFMKDIVMGIERHLKEYEEGCEYLKMKGSSINLISHAARERWEIAEFGLSPNRFTGSIDSIWFEPGGSLLPGSSEDAYYFSASPFGLPSVCKGLSDDELFQKYHPLQNDEFEVYLNPRSTNAEGDDETTRLLRDARGILSLFPAWGGRSAWLTLPLVHFIGNELPVAEIIKEV
jgi:hypothetical protein